MANKIRIKFLNNIRKDERFVTSKALEFCPTINLRDAHHAKTHVILTLSSEAEIISLLSDTAIEKFKEVGLKPLCPPKLYTDRTIYVTKLRPYITDLHYSEILDELNSYDGNPKIQKVFLIPNKSSYSKTLKLICETPEEATKACAEGIFLYDIQVSPENIRKETYTHIDQCFKCFSLNHATFKCPSEKEFCSICAQEHHYSKCTNKDNPKCKLCDGNHTAISYSCPVRKLHMQNLNEKQQQAVNQMPTHNPQIATTIVTTPAIDKSNFPSLPTASKQPAIQPQPVNHRKRSACTSHHHL